MRDQRSIAKYRGLESSREAKGAPWRAVPVAKPERETTDAEECQLGGITKKSSPDAKQVSRAS
jgi:hypothetical protein